MKVTRSRIWATYAKTLRLVRHEYDADKLEYDSDSSESPEDQTSHQRSKWTDWPSINAKDMRKDNKYGEAH